MSLNKNESLSSEMIKSSNQSKPVDTSKTSENNDLLITKKESYQDILNLSSGLFSNKKVDDSNSLNKNLSSFEFSDNKNLDEQSNFKVLNNKVLTKNPDFKIFDMMKIRSRNYIDNPEQIINNVKAFVLRRNAGLLGKKNKNLLKTRKGSRVVSEGTKQMKVEQKNEVEEWLDDDVFPSNQLQVSTKMNSLMKKQKTAHTRSGSAVFIQVPTKPKAIEELNRIPCGLINENNNNKNPPNLNFKTPVKKDKKKRDTPPSLTRPIWQQNEIKKLKNNDMHYMLVNENLCPLTPTKWYPSLQKRSLNEIKETYQENALSNQGQNDLQLNIFGESDPNVNLFSGDNPTFTSSKSNLTNNFEIRLERFDALFNSDKSIDADNKENENIFNAKTSSILNPNVISFEANIFDNIISEQVNEFQKNPFDIFNTFSESKSKQSKSSSNENSI